MSDFNRWLAFWNRINAKGSPDNIYADLNRLYSESHRAYHNLFHIRHCLGEFEQTIHLLNYPNEVEMAIWFHDAIYNTQREDNEEKSAELARQVSRTIELTDSFAEKAYNLILSTKHTMVPDDMDAQTLVDIDLCIIGRPDEEFDEYERSIRNEYSWVLDKQFKAVRASILQGFLDRPYIYYTKFFRQKYEDQARRNLKSSLIQLR